jgi:hypothetical protein
VVAPTCGEPKKVGTSSSGLPLAGPTWNTSKAAPAVWPLSNYTKPFRGRRPVDRGVARTQ